MKPEYSWTKEAPALIFSKASEGLIIPPTPIIGIFPFDDLCINLMTWVDLSFNGAPLRPPFSLTKSLSDLRLFLSTVVLVAIMPSKPVSSTTLIMFNNCVSFKSGAILSKTGFGWLLDLLFFWMEFKSDFKLSWCCKSLKFSVFGELTFTAK